MRRTMTTVHGPIGCLALFACAGLAASAAAQQTFPEVEPNETKAAAQGNGAIVMASGDSITGQTTGSTTSGGGPTSRDMFLIKTPALAPGVYRHRIELTVDSGTLHSTVNLRGLSQSTAGVINPATDISVQNSSSVTTPAPARRVNAWYGFGKEEQVYYFVQGTTTTTGTYTATLFTEPVTLSGDLGLFQQGTIEISTVELALSETALWVLDSNFNVIPEYSNVWEPAPGTAPRSRLTRTFAPGVYYLVIGRRTQATATPSASDDRVRNANAMDFPDILVGDNANTTGGLNFSVADQYGAVNFAASVSDRFQSRFFRFEVGTVTATGACCAPDGTCAATTSASCASRGGVYHGDGVLCVNVTCDQPGACCVAPFGCQIRSAAQCASAGGTYQGNGTSCAGAGCAPAVITLVGPFSGALTEDLNSFPTSTSQGCFRAFGNQADVCPISGIFWLVTGYSSACSLSPLAPSTRVLGGTSAGTRITFDQPVSRFGAHFGVAQGYTAFFADFFDVNGAPIAPRITMQNHFPDCGWRWNGWEFAVPVKTIEFRSNASASGPWVGMSGVWNADPAGAVCYANCDSSTQAPVLNVQDFSCFLTRYAAGESYANCDDSTQAPVLNVQDFSCFLTKYAAGCP